jgi:hypothetical protein
VKERDEQISANRQELQYQLNGMEIYTDEMSFRTFHEKKQKDLRML